MKRLLQRARELQAEIRYKILTLTDSKPDPCMQSQQHSNNYTNRAESEAQTKCQSMKSSPDQKQTQGYKYRENVG